MRVFLAAALLCASLCAEEGLRLRYRYVHPETQELRTGHGTAVAISKNTILTAAHNCDHPDLAIFDNGWRGAAVIFKSAKYDLALLRVDGAAFEPVIFGEDVKLGEKIRISGCKRGAAPETHDAVVEEYFHDGGLKHLAKTQFDHGESGAPVLKDGKLAGITVSSISKNGELDPDYCLFVPISAIKLFLEEQP